MIDTGERRQTPGNRGLAGLLAALLLAAAQAGQTAGVGLVDRPARLVADMAPGPLRDTLEECRGRPLQTSGFSIGHRGAPLGYPEHTRESYLAAARQGAGVLECDVTFTADHALVCRHAQCDLHSTTDILATPLAAKCSEPFTPARFDAAGRLAAPASARCCASDLTLAEFRTLRGKRDAFDRRATTPRAAMALDRTARPRFGALMTHAESIALFDALGVAMTPELKAPDVPMPHNGFSQQDYAAALIEEYLDAGIEARRVWPQSFQLDDVLFWQRRFPAFAAQAVYLDGRYSEPGFDPGDASTWRPAMGELRASGIRVLAPPLWMLLTLDGGRVAPSAYAAAARAAGLDLITWTLERPGYLAGGGGWYYRSIRDAIDREGDVLEVLDVLARQVGVRAVFSDWPATVTFYANCMGLD